MPTILRKNGFRFFFYSNEGTEPPHIHIVGRGGELKIWIKPIQVQRVYRLSDKDIKDALKITEENVNLFLNCWRQWHESNS